MNIDLLKQLHCPGGGPRLEPASVSRQNAGDVYSGSVHCPRGGLYAITDGILDLRPEHVGPLSLAQRSNQFSMTATGYEWIWRVRSLSLLTGETFPVSRELAMMLDAVGEPREGLWLDLGCSTGLYGRALAKHVAGAGGSVIMLDLAMPMLRNAGERVHAAGLDNVGRICGRGERLPFGDGQLAGVVCGGSLNEFGPHGVETVLRETRRCLAPEAPSFWMYLLESDGRGRLLQTFVQQTGILFWQPPEVERLFARAGLRVVASDRFGIVGFATAVRA